MPTTFTFKLGLSRSKGCPECAKSRIIDNIGYIVLVKQSLKLNVVGAPGPKCSVLCILYLLHFEQRLVLAKLSLKLSSTGAAGPYVDTLVPL